MSDLRFELNEQTMPVVKQIGAHMPGGFFIYRAQAPGELLYANQALIDIFGCDDLEDFKRLTGFTFRGMVHPEDYAAIAGSIDKQIAESGDGMDYVEYRIVRRDGAERWVDDFGHYTETDAYGGLYYVFLSDITEKRKQRELERQLAMQEKLLEEERRQAQQQKLITALSSDYRGVYYIELDKDEGVCYQIHSGLARGYRTGERFAFLRGLTDYAETYVVGEFRTEFLRFIQPESIRAGLRNERVVSYRYKVVQQGRESYEMIRFAGVRHPEDRDDNYVHAVSMCFMDVDSDTRRTLEQSRALSDALARAEDASKAKTLFLSNMSHEIRTPITGILGMNEMIRRESDSEDVLSYSENINKAGVSLLGIINDILDFSKIESGKMELIEADYDLAAMIRDVANLMRLRAEEKGLVFQVSVDGALPARLRGDEIRIKQILTNLLSNAVKYTERGSVRMSFGRLDEADGFVRLRVSVTDTGIGIRPEDIGKLFTAFERLDQIRTRKILGTGLGLPITQKMLSLMGSELEVESVYGAGSVFSFTLRQEICGAGCVGSFDLPVPDGAPRRSRTPFVAPGARILVVDDTAMNIQVISGLLKRTKMQIDTAQSGAAGIERFSSADYDLVFMDYRMPDMDGIETLGRMKSLYPEKVRRTPIICLTASAVSGTKEHLIGSGFTDYLSKPVDIEKMEAVLIRFLPKEKITLAEDAPQEDPLALLPAEVFDVPNLDPAAGITFCGDAESYVAALRSFSASIEARADQLGQCVDAMDIAGCTLRAHSLKSTARAIGALEVSNRARALGEAGSRGDAEALRRDAPLLLEAYRSLKEPLEALFRTLDGAAEKPPLSEAEFDDARAAIHELCALYDDAGIQDVLDELKGRVIPDSRAALYRDLCEAAGRVDWEALSALTGAR